MLTSKHTIIFTIVALISLISFYAVYKTYPQHFLKSHKLSVTISQLDGMYNVVVCKKNVDCDPRIQKAYDHILLMLPNRNNKVLSISSTQHETKNTILEMNTKAEFIIPQNSNNYADNIFVVGNQSNFSKDFPGDRNNMYRINIIFGSIGDYLFYNYSPQNSWAYNRAKIEKIVEVITTQIVTGRNRLDDCEICKSA